MNGLHFPSKFNKKEELLTLEYKESINEAKSFIWTKLILRKQKTIQQARYKGSHNSIMENYVFTSLKSFEITKNSWKRQRNYKGILTFELQEIKASNKWVLFWRKERVKASRWWEENQMLKLLEPYRSWRYLYMDKNGSMSLIHKHFKKFTRMS